MLVFMGGASDVPVVGRGARLARDVVLYTSVRIALVAVITALIVVATDVMGVPVPLLPALFFALVIALPLSFVLFKGLRARVVAGIAAIDAERRRNKTELRARLRGGS